jgi:hypothetical protein
MHTVHLRINDSSTGLPAPVRLRITGPSGETFAPLGRSAEFPTGRNEAVGGHLKLGGERWCYIDGSCEVPLPAGVELRVQATRGPEYRPLDERVTLGPGQISLRLEVQRAINVRQWNYVSGDTRCHFLPANAGLLEAMAEDLGVVNALAAPISLLAQDGNAYSVTPDLLSFSGQAAALSSGRHHFVVNTLNTHPVLGKVGLLNSHRTVFPLTFGGPEETDDWSVCDWCDQCHRKKGLSIWVDAFAAGRSVQGGEALIAAVLGKIDAIEIDPHWRNRQLLPWIYRLWDAGVVLPLAGGSGKDSNKTALGSIRTYGHVPGEFSVGGWIEAVRAGKTFITSGPVLDFRIDGCLPGETVTSSGRVEVAIAVKSLVPIERLEVLANNAVVYSGQPRASEGDDIYSLEVNKSLELPRSCWMAVRCVGKDVLAHSSAVTVLRDSQPLPRTQEGRRAFVKLIEETREWCENHGRYQILKRKEQLLARCAAAVEKLVTEQGP